MNSANDKYGASLDRPPGMSKPVDPATRLSELLAQSLEELTRPFDPARPGQHPPAREERAVLAPQHEPPAEPQPESSTEQVRIDAVKALAELEADLFAAAKQVDRDPAIPPEETDPPAHAHDDHPHAEPPSEPVEAEMAALLAAHPPEKDATPEGEIKPEIVPLAPVETKAGEPEPAPDDAASAVIARVRRLMLVSMA